MEQRVYPIKDKNILKQVEETLKDSFKYGERNYMIFVLAKCTLLRVSDTLALRYDSIYDDRGNVYRNAYIHEQKTKKKNLLYLRPCETELLAYRKWLDNQHVNSPWLFPSMRTPSRHINQQGFYKIMQHVGDLLGLNYLGTHTARKTGAYMVYEQTNHNIALVMKLLNHSSMASTLYYLGLEQDTLEQTLDTIRFD